MDDNWVPPVAEETPNKDYISITPAWNGKRFITCVMKWHRSKDEYVPTQVCEPMSEVMARSIARRWSERMGLEIRE